MTGVESSPASCELSALKAHNDGGDHRGYAPFAVWLLCSLHPDSIVNTFHYLNKKNSCPHVIWRPETGEIIESIPEYRAGRACSKWINRGGLPGLQIVVVAPEGRPFTDGPCRASQDVSRWLSSRGVPQVWPKGPPGLTGPQVKTYRANQKPIIGRGHYAANQLDEKLTGIGQIDTGRLFEGGYEV